MFKTKQKKQINFVRSLKRFPRNPFIKRKKTPEIFLALRILIYLILIMLSGLVICNFSNLVLSTHIAKESIKAKSLLDQSIYALEQKDLARSYDLARQGQVPLQRIQDYVKDLHLWPDLEIMQTPKAMVNNVLDAGIITTDAIQNLLSLANEFNSLAGQENQNLQTISDQQKKDILSSLLESSPHLHGIKAELELASFSLDQINVPTFADWLGLGIRKFKIKVNQIQEIITKAIPVCDSLPRFLGLSKPQTYLLVLQNNTELRPTGGFIGTYGIIKVKDGKIISFNTDNIYNLDEPNKETLHIEPPWPLKKYNAVNDWFMRDANWSPDWPTSARKIEWFYHLEGGQEKKIDGVIAIDPDFIKSLLKITGPIKVDGLEFNEKNFTEELEYQVEKGYLRKGIESSERKEIIGSLGNQLLDKIYKIPVERWPSLWQSVKESIDQKHVLAYLKNQELQKQVILQNWGGEIKNVHHDYLMVVDANLASLKTDSVMERSIHYQLNENDQGDLIAKTIITYENNGGFTWLTTRYRTYARIYIPLGSELISTTGSMQDSRTNIPGETETSQESNKTVFGTFISVEPGELRQLIFEYKLPESVKRYYHKGNYSLLVQKQAGTKGHKLTLDLTPKKRVQSVNTDLPTRTLFGNKITATGDLREDRKIRLIFK